MLTADYGFWLHIDDIETFNDAARLFDLRPSIEAQAARGRGRCVLENDERVDVLARPTARRS